MITDIILILLLSLIPTCFSYLLDYCLGQPGSDEFHPREIFSGYTIWMSKTMLPKERLKQIYDDHESLLKDPDPLVRSQWKDQMNKVIIEDAKKLFTWEKSIGMCIFCTNFWISLFFAWVFYNCDIPLHSIFPICFYFLIPIFSHTILRKL